MPLENGIVSPVQCIERQASYLAQMRSYLQFPHSLFSVSFGSRQGQGCIERDQITFCLPSHFKRRGLPADIK